MSWERRFAVEDGSVSCGNAGWSGARSKAPKNAPSKEAGIFAEIREGIGEPSSGACKRIFTVSRCDAERQALREVPAYALIRMDGFPGGISDGFLDGARGCPVDWQQAAALRQDVGSPPLCPSMPPAGVRRRGDQVDWKLRQTK